MHEAERGLFELQQGRSLYVTASERLAAKGGILLATVDGLTSQTLERLRRLSAGSIRLAITQQRAQAMGLTNGGRPCDISLELRGETNPDQILHLSSATGDFGTNALDLRAASAAEVGGLSLARLGRFLPAIVSVAVDTNRSLELRNAMEVGAVLVVTTAQIDDMAANTRLDLIHVSDGPVPLEEAENAHFMLFREANGLLEHLAILIGNRERWPDSVPVRIHSACLTGDLFGSLRCDCGDQLRGSLRVFATSGGGVLLYLSQEGRGIGLGNKLRAYALQHEGLDTVDADGTLGFGPDERRYDAAVEMLRQLRIEKVQLLTNNPEKVRSVSEGGIQVMNRQPLYGTLNRHNLLYVQTKAQRAGHWLGEMLSGAIPDR